MFDADNGILDGRPPASLLMPRSVYSLAGMGGNMWREVSPAVCSNDGQLLLQVRYWRWWGGVILSLWGDRCEGLHANYTYHKTIHWTAIWQITYSARQLDISTLSLHFIYYRNQY